MKIASTTLIGPNTLDLLENAIRSVARAVDVVILIPTFPDFELKELQRTARLAGVREPERLLVSPFTWVDDFAAARNFALALASGAGADWAVTVDTDERILSGRMPTCGLDALELSEILESTDAQVGMVLAEDGSYSKDRLFRLPTELAWHGRTHEFFAYTKSRFTLPRVRFYEVAKDADQLRAKHERDRALLDQMTQEEPRSGRWRFYLGQALDGLGQHELAIDSYLRCGAMPGWDEERAWAYYQAAVLQCKAHEYGRAIDTCGIGLAVHAGFAELSWLAAYASHQLGRHEQAVFWSVMSSAVGKWNGVGRAFHRVGFRHPPAYYEAPFDVLHYAWLALGDERSAHVAKVKGGHALDFREGKVPEVDPEKI